MPGVQGIDDLRLMVVDGRKATVSFKRGDTIDRQDVRATIWPLDTKGDTVDIAVPSMDAQVVERRGWAASSTGRATDS